jgi:2,3-bisphosphoglycerate-independent phosphoglycerate mutase
MILNHNTKVARVVRKSDRHKLLDSGVQKFCVELQHYAEEYPNYLKNHPWSEKDGHKGMNAVLPRWKGKLVERKHLKHSEYGRHFHQEEISAV